MHIIDVFGGEKLPVSFEIFPPKGDLPVEEAREVIGGLAPLSPSFVSVTYSAGGSGNSSRTIDVAKMAQDEYGLNMMAHLTCMNADRAGIDSVLASMKAAGIENVLSLRGDAVPGATPKDFKFAKDLIPVAREAGFCVGAAAYPEGHIDCLDFDESIRHLKEKQDAGAQFFVTQLFFDNDLALRFLDAYHVWHHAVSFEGANPAHGIHVRRELAVAHHQAARALRRRPEGAAPGGHRLCVPAVRGPLEGRRRRPACLHHESPRYRTSRRSGAA